MNQWDVLGWAVVGFGLLVLGLVAFLAVWATIDYIRTHRP
jgi:hypothetical protein